eukprot:gb/GECH01010739.1/.p1 GENE.gb/GECH01010739.1/~~gb/GECH01010739.1/.p1  ORF type:complete len:645 (+),score=160.80 gb/GECH01010739.1/:1-1935(+)
MKYDEDEHSYGSLTYDNSSIEDLLVDFNRLYAEGILADTTLYVGPSKRQFKVHRAILACRCEYFNNMFHSGMLESQQSSIEIPDKNPDAFAVLLDYFYTAKTRITPENAFEVMRLADEYNVGTVKDQCIDYVKHQIDPENAFEILEESRFHKYSALINSCTQFIEQNAKKMFSSERFKNLSKESLIYLLQSNNLILHELEIFRCVIEWGMNQLKMDTNTCSCEKLPSDLKRRLFFDIPIDTLDPYLARKIKENGDYDHSLSSSSSSSSSLSDSCASSPYPQTSRSSVRLRLSHKCRTHNNKSNDSNESNTDESSDFTQAHINHEKNESNDLQDNDNMSTISNAGSVHSNSLSETSTTTTSPQQSSSSHWLVQDPQILNKTTGGQSKARRERSGSGSSKTLRRRGASLSEKGEEPEGVSHVRNEKHQEEILEALAQILAPVLKYIRFPTLTSREILEYVESTQIVPKELILEAYRYHALKDQPQILPNMQLRTRIREGSLFYHSGVLENVEIRWLRGWTLCYHKPYADRTSSEIFRRCKGTRILVAAKHKNSVKLALCAMGRIDVVTQETFEHETLLENGVYWYNWPNHAFGFSSTSNINLGSADLAEGTHKLSWHLTGRGGYRCGEIKTLNESAEWEKLVFWAE